MIVADTSAWIDYFSGISAAHTDALDDALLNNRVVIGDLIITELLQGFKNDKEYRIVLNLMDSLEYRDMLGKELAIQSARNYRILRKKGVTIRKTIDVMIATFCMENGFMLIHNDRDFDPMQHYLKLKVIL